MSSPTNDLVRPCLAMLAAMIVAVASSVAAADEEHGHDPATVPEPAAEAPATDPMGQTMPEHMPAMPGMSKMMPTMPGASALMMPQMDPARGRHLFASKGCVACHSVNGVGGHDAAALDAHTMEPMMNPFEFAAKMWRMAPAMVYAQEEGIGYQILFTGDEIADIIAFVHDDAEQHRFTEADIPPEIRKLMGHAHGAPAAHGHMEGEAEHHD